METTLNVDETGHEVNGERFWTWVFKAELYVAVQFCIAHLIRDIKFLFITTDLAKRVSLPT